MEENVIETTAEDYVTTVSYRGYDVPIYMDDAGQQYYCILDGEDIGFGTYNTDYKTDLEYLIDQKLDVIYRFEEPYFGAKLEWFDNGGFRDIRLVYRTRTLRVFLCKEGLTELTGEMKTEILNTSRYTLETLVDTNRN